MIHLKKDSVVLKHNMILMETTDIIESGSMLKIENGKKQTYTYDLNDNILLSVSDFSNVIEIKEVDFKSRLKYLITNNVKYIGKEVAG